MDSNPQNILNSTSLFLNFLPQKKVGEYQKAGVMTGTTESLSAFALDADFWAKSAVCKTCHFFVAVYFCGEAKNNTEADSGNTPMQISMVNFTMEPWNDTGSWWMGKKDICRHNHKISVGGMWSFKLQLVGSMLDLLGVYRDAKWVLLTNHGRQGGLSVGG